MSVAVSFPYIESTPSLFQGEPHIAGVRIRVRDIVLARDQGGFTPEEIAATVYPDVTLVQVYSALGYYEQNRIEIERAAQRQRDAVEEFRQKNTHLLTDHST